MIRSVLFLTAAAAFILAVHTQATTLVIIRTPQEVIAAADSAVGNDDSSVEHGANVASDFCKIVRVGNSETFLMFAGAVDANVRHNDRPAPEFSFHGVAMAKAAAKVHGTMVEKANAFQKAALQPFTQSVLAFKKHAPALYKLRFLGHAQAMEVVFFGLNPDKIPAMAIVDFSFSEDQAGKPIVSPSEGSCPGTDCDPREPHAEVLGENEAATRAWYKPGFYTGGDLADAAQRLVNVEIQDKPQSVKPPVDVLRVSILGPTWMALKKGCRK